ncbi:hypothetical protein BABINDRAFT_163898 [Babjeviella inositovora NRRL Y-12698]|uniref:ferric-chelate reductase (NADPH) n=1 Tax=Babjeviella inositovora NRRL Y-12698 TaxID=984486 RepID=A0A1E3QHC3_9ASCO|nr:uncharacterized protein BABINDRAFT_163898 [Babjeviella inositovora NRRL Y-12698]ODQ76998.1 hypothetical protein BABINDRAFT_163898 [Babjeviella inositovora NRRL Y-12698]
MAIAIIAVLLSSTAVQAKYHTYTASEHKVLACKNTLDNAARFCEGRNRDYKCVCTNSVDLGSVLYCIKDNDWYDDGTIAFLRNSCNAFAAKELADNYFDLAYENATKYIITPDKSFNKTLITHVPITVKKSLVVTRREANMERFKNYDWGMFLGGGFVAFMGFVMLVSCIANWGMLIFPSFTQKICNGTISKAYRKYVTLPATFKKSRNVPLMFLGVPVGLVPTRLESIVVALLYVYMLLACAVDYRHVDNNPIWKRPMGEIGREVGDRTGILALFTYPLLIIFAGRNNILLWVTRWNFSVFNCYHRHLGRIYFLVTIAHAIGMSLTQLASSMDRYKATMLANYVIWGTIATAFMGFLCVQGMLVLRRKSYELFLATHILFAIFVLVGTHIHLVPFGYENFTWACAGLWVFDRFIRLARLVGYGIKTATVTLKADETFKVTVAKPTYWKAGPGQYAYVTFFRASCFWQSHPFTIMSEDENNITFAIKVKGGFSHGIYKHLASMPGQTAQIKVAIEGPYGFASPTSKYDQSLLLASGNGIPGLYDHAISLVQSDHGKQSVKLVWVARNWKSLSWMYEELVLLKGTKVETIIYITRPESGIEEAWGTSSASSANEDKKEDENSAENNLNNLKSSLSHIQFVEGRPDMEALVRDEITVASGSLAVVACGHDGAVDDARYTVAHNLDKSAHRVDFFEELQVWT